MRVSKHCLVSELDEKEAYENMFTYIAQLDEEIKAENPLYEERLQTCKACSSLQNGVCRVCGCFVEMRAAVRTNKCPSKHW